MKKISEKLLRDIDTAKAQVLNDEELDLISGGSTQNCSLIVKQDGGDDGDYCTISYNCYITLHIPKLRSASRTAITTTTAIMSSII